MKISYHMKCGLGPNKKRNHRTNSTNLLLSISIFCWGCMCTGLTAQQNAIAVVFYHNCKSATCCFREWKFYLCFQLILYFVRDASLRDLRASSGDIVRIGNSNEMINSVVHRDKETDTNHQNKKDNISSDAPHFQSGVLRTNCIDCLDRTNVAQYAYGLQALGRQLHVMGLTDVPKVDPDSSIAAAIMDMYQSMGDALAQ